MSIINTDSFGPFRPVSWTITHSFGGPGVISTINESWGVFMCRSSRLAVFVDSDLFQGYYSPFWGTEVISMLVEPQAALMCRSSTLILMADSGCFMDYYSLFWCSGVASTINETWGAFTCWSSTLVVFVDSDPFRGLLLTVLGSRSDFHAC